MGSVIDLALPVSRLPDRVAVDSNLIIPRLLSGLHTPHPTTAVRVAQFFSLLGAGNSLALITPTVFSEVLHFAVTAKYRSEMGNHQPELVARFPAKRGFDWKDLYKINNEILQRFAPDLERFRRLLLATGIEFTQPHDLVPRADGRSFDEELVEMMGRYGLDSSDSAILWEAERAGVSAIVTLDRDLRRAAVDFDIYTWL